MNDNLHKINKFIEGKTFVHDHYVRFNDSPVKVYYQFHIDEVKRLIDFFLVDNGDRI